MSPDTFTSVSTESWFSRLGNSIKSVLIGIVLFLVSFPVLFLNEWRAVTTTRAIKEVAQTVDDTATPGEVDPSKENTLIHLSGEATTDETLSDPDFGVAVGALKLRRVVKMYQWQEEKETKTKKKTGGKEETTTTYSYKLDWSEGRNNSSEFEYPEDHENPPLAYESRGVTAERITLGAYALSAGLIGQINNYAKLPVTKDTHAKLPAAKQAELRLQGDQFYRPVNAKPTDKPADADTPAPTDGEAAAEGEAATDGPAENDTSDGDQEGDDEDSETQITEEADITTPQLGDLRISFEAVKPEPVSIIAEQSGHSFAPHQTKAGREIEWLYEETLTSEQMCDRKHSENSMFTWILRAVGFVLMALGIGMVFRPLVVLADVIPLFGNILGAGVFIFSIVVALPLTLATIAASWIVVRPILGGILLAVAVAIIIGTAVVFKKKKPTG